MTAAGGPLGWVADELARLDRDGLRRPTRTCRVLPGGRVEIDGREMWNFGSNDYLGLASEHPAAGPPARGATASPAIVGRSPEVADLERAVADHEGTADAVVFPTGYAANLGAVSALTGPGDVVFADRACHACLIDGARLGGGRLRVFRDGRAGLMRLDRELARAADARRRWVLTEAVFSMDGRRGSLGHLLRAADRSDAVVLADFAHATGLDLLTPPPRPADHPRLVVTGTLSKAVGAAGGFAAGSRDLCDFLRHAAKSHIFSTALPPGVAAAAAANLRRLGSDPGPARRLRSLVRRFHARAAAVLQPTDPDCEIPIVPVFLGDPAAAVAASEELARESFFVPAIRPPTVPRGTSRLRVSLSAAHPPHAVDALADAVVRVCGGGGNGAAAGCYSRAASSTIPA